MQYSLAHQLGKRSGGLDPDAKAYIAAVETAGASVNATQKAAINTFVKTGKSDGWYSSIKRLYLPIWSSSAPNAICMTSLTSGTFNGTVTHAAGYVQGNGSTGYFNMGISPSALGLTTGSSGAVILIKSPMTTAGTRAHMSCGNTAGSSTFGLQVPAGTSLRFSNGAYINPAANVDAVYAGTSQEGIIAGLRFGGVTSLRHRLTAGVSQLAADTEANAGVIPVNNLFGMAWNVNNSAANFTDAEYGAFATHAGISDADSDAMTLALKNLWETCTSLSLP